MKQYLDLLDNIMKNGCEKGDRTGTGTKSIFGTQMRFNLQEGFPLVTTKKIHFKSVVHELLYFINGEDNNTLLQKDGVKIWDKWGDSNGNLGPMYAHQLRNFGGKYKNIPQPLVLSQRHFKNLSVEETDYKGETFNSSKYGNYKVIKRERLDAKEAHYLIQFERTGYSYVVRDDKLKSGMVKDMYCPSLYGAGYMGVGFKEYQKETWFEKVLITWRAMINRCYNKSHENYGYYGGKGVFVCDRWLCFSNFLKDAPYLRGWDGMKTNREIEKDSNGNGFTYSTEMSVWASKEDNLGFNCHLLYTVENKETGAQASFRNSTGFRKTSGVKNQGNFDSMLRGERESCEGWVLLSAQDLDKGVDQLSEVIKSIKSAPFSRRHVLSLWNASDLSYQALACCHGTTIQFNCRPLTVQQRVDYYQKKNGVEVNVEISGEIPDYITDEDIPKYYLDCMMVQRSQDHFLGASFNIASYSLLTHMVAQVTNTIPGEFIHTSGDVHCYSNHYEQAELQLTREPYPLPEIKLNPKITNINDFRYEDIELVGYQSHPRIKAPVAV